WTVPLDTGKTFTVTQNVREGDVANIVRPHSEIKVTTPSEAPARMLPQEHPQSAPPELSEQASNQSPAKLIEEKMKQNQNPSAKIATQEKLQYHRPVPGSTLRCLDDPNFPDINSPPSVVSARNIVNPGTVEVVDKARDRFDRFWGNTNEEKE
ncbi:CLUMA_CG019140, isoform A, partial [Clunio marinus]